MTRAIPKEEREKIVSAYYNGLGTVSELSLIFNISEWSVYKYLRLHRETGDLTPQKQPGRPPVITDKVLDIIHRIVNDNPDGTLDDYREQLQQETGIIVTFVTIHNACKELDLRRKKRAFSRQSKNVRMYKKKE